MLYDNRQSIDRHGIQILDECTDTKGTYQSFAKIESCLPDNLLGWRCKNMETKYNVLQYFNLNYWPCQPLLNFANPAKINHKDETTHTPGKLVRSM